MPLSFTKPPKVFLATKVSRAVSGLIARLTNEVFILLFLGLGATIAFVTGKPLGFYILASIFIVGYFGERIARIIKRKKE